MNFSTTAGQLLLGCILLLTSLGVILWLILPRKCSGCSEIFSPWENFLQSGHFQFSCPECNRAKKTMNG